MNILTLNVLIKAVRCFIKYYEFSHRNKTSFKRSQHSKPIVHKFESLEYYFQENNFPNFAYAEFFMLENI